jgi:hypothetical protein
MINHMESRFSENDSRPSFSPIPPRNTWPGCSLGFVVPAPVAELARVRGSECEAKIKSSGCYDANNFAKRIKCPVLVGTGLCDTVARPETQLTR